MRKYWIGTLLLASMPVWAILPHGATPAELAMCQARDFQGHYCDGYRFIDRAYSAMGNKLDMKYYLEVAINSFDYELSHTKEDDIRRDIRRGEAHLGKARALKLMGRNGEAAAEFNKALRYKPDSQDIYQALADYYQEAGNKQKAMEMATEGLKRNPSSKGLKRRYTEFGGKLPYPEAVDKAMPAEEVRAEIKPVEKLEAAPSSGVTTGQASDPTKLTAPIGPTPETEPPKIGSPKNPYCRFCPD